MEYTVHHSKIAGGPTQHDNAWPAHTAQARHLSLESMWSPGEEKPRRRKKKVSTEPKPKKISKKAAELIACASQSLKIWSESEMDLALKHLRQADPSKVPYLNLPPLASA